MKCPFTVPHALFIFFRTLPYDFTYDYYLPPTMKFLVEIFQFELLVMKEKNIFAYKLLL